MAAPENSPTTSRLILIKHSRPAIELGKPASAWLLSENGEKLCIPLADRVTLFKPGLVFSSREPKAQQTAAILASQLNLPVSVYPNLHEHLREQAGFSSQMDFESAVAQFFEHPDTLVFGEETAHQAYNRFAQAIDQLTALHPKQNLAVVTHGTVLSLLVARRCGLHPFPFWRDLGLPSFVVIVLPSFSLEGAINHISK